MPEFSTATATAVSIAQSLLTTQKDKGPITAALITERVNIAAAVVAPGNEQSIDKGAAISELIRRFSIWIGQDTAMADITGHEAWLGAAKKKDWRYWPRYQDMLERSMSSTAVEAVNVSTDRILGLMEDPARHGAWDRRGLVVGHVQSGKTANYSGLICKAADSGYKIIIILAGLHNNLRSQTQIRLSASKCATNIELGHVSLPVSAVFASTAALSWKRWRQLVQVGVPGTRLREPASLAAP